MSLNVSEVLYVLACIQINGSLHEAFIHQGVLIYCVFTQIDQRHESQQPCYECWGVFKTLWLICNAGGRLKQCGIMLDLQEQVSDQVTQPMLKH